MENQKNQVLQYIESIRGEIEQLAKDIHAHPEIAFEEFTAVELIGTLMKKHSFAMETNYKGLPTAFRVDACGQPGGPRIAFLAEYDALAGCGHGGTIGHGCGHNLIAACSTAAFLGMASVIDRFKGSVCLIGTPAEEGGGGKVKLLEGGAFDDVDYALMMHPTAGGIKSNLVGRGGRASGGINIRFYGKGAHSSVPKNGINALSAVIHTFTQIDLLRPTFDPQDNINGIITDGGTAANIIPAFASCKFSLRAETMKRIDDLIAIVQRCVKNAENLTGARAELEWGDITAERYPNKPLNQAFKDNMATLGIEMVWPDAQKQYGSSDIGNVSIKIPAIHDYLSITDDPGVLAHTVEYTDAAVKPQALDICVKGGIGLAMTGCDILSNEQFQQEVLSYHEQQIPDFYKQ